MGLSVDLVVVPPFMENAYLAADEATGAALIVDPGGGVAQLAKLVAERGLTVTAIACTHGHVDHLAGGAEARRRFGAPLLLHSADRELASALGVQAMVFGFPETEDAPVDRWLSDREVIEVGGARATVIHTPGHTPGGCCFYFEAERTLFTGDTLFAGSIGRTDLPGGSTRELLASIRDRLLPLGDDVAFYPGHGPGGSLGDERRDNPFLGRMRAP